MFRGFAQYCKKLFEIFNFRKDVRLPVSLQRAMAAEAEADREARAKIITAEGEIKASKALKEASLVMVDNPIALQVRYVFSITSWQNITSNVIYSL